MSEMRTYEQYCEIVELMDNGAWSSAAETAVECGFFAVNLREYATREVLDGTLSEQGALDRLSDLIELAEMAAEKRYR